MTQTLTLSKQKKASHGASLERRTKEAVLHLQAPKAPKVMPWMQHICFFGATCSNVFCCWASVNRVCFKFLDVLLIFQEVPMNKEVFFC